MVPFNQVDHAIKIGIACTEAARYPVPATLRDFLTIYDNVELTGLAWDNCGFHVKASPEDSRETRDLGLIAVSGRAVNNFDYH